MIVDCNYPFGVNSFHKQGENHLNLRNYQKTDCYTIAKYFTVVFIYYMIFCGTFQESRATRVISMLELGI